MRRQALALVVALSACSQPRSFDRLKSDGYLELRRGDLRAARAIADEGLQRARRARDSGWKTHFQVLSAEILVEEMRNTEALALLQERPPSVDLPEALKARAAMTRGYARCLIGGADETFRDAEADLQEAARLATAIKSPEAAAEVTLRQGICAVLRGDAPAGEAHLRATVDAARRHHLQFLEARGLASIGYLKARTRRYDEGAAWLGNALELVSSLGADLPTIKVLANLGWCYYELGDYERALAFLSRADALADARGQTGVRLIALQNIGRVHYQLRELDRADAFYRRALAIAGELGDRTLVAELQNNLAVVALDQGRYEDAETAVREALRIKAELRDLGREQYSRVVEGLISAARGDLPKAEALYRRVLASPDSDTLIRWSSGAALADALVRMDRPTEAEAEYRKSFGLMEASYAELREAEHRISFFSSLDQFHDDYVDFLVTSGRTGRALEVADRGRARQLREILEAGAKGPIAAPYLARAARSLDAMILFYSLAPSRSFLWALTPGGVQLRVLPGEAEIRNHVEAHQRRVLQARDPLAEESSDAEWLYRTLIGPVAASVPPRSRVVFIPDGALYQLNPETLVVPSPRPHYWIEDVTLLTAPSMSLLAAAGPGAARWVPRPSPRAGGRRSDPATILLIGDPLPTGDEFPRLAQAERELSRIADQFTPAERTVYSGARAVPSAYSTSVPRRFEFIHFAAHAQASREVPLDSAVILTTEKDSAKLYARDVVKLPLQAELVTLSACRSAGSRTFAGEGLVGLGWAFLSAGAENVIAGLWNVEDASTSELMADLYRGVRHGLPPADALRHAKLELLRSQTAYRKPFYWAPFMIYTRSPEPRGRGRLEARASQRRPRVAATGP